MADAMFDGLTTRAVVGAGLALVAIVAVAVGGVAFTVLVAAAVLLMSAEWSVMQGISRPFRVLSLVGLAVVGGVAANASAGLAVVVLGAIAGGLGLFMVGEMSDTMAYSRVGGQNRLHVTKRLHLAA